MTAIAEKISKIIDVKSIVTLLMTGALIVLLICGIEPQRELLALYCTSYGSIITYFFTKKKDGEQSDVGI